MLLKDINTTINKKKRDMLARDAIKDSDSEPSQERSYSQNKVSKLLK